MKINRTLLSAALTIATVIGGSTVAQAASVTVTSNILTGAAPLVPSPGTLTFDQFDGSLGTLTGITITLTASAKADLIVQNNSASDHNFTNAVAIIPVTITANAGPTLPHPTITVQSTATKASDTVLADQTNTYSGVMGPSMSDSKSLDSGDFAAYTGTGSSTVTVDITVLDGTYGGTGTGVFFGGGNPEFTAQVSVVYDFTPNAIPEPTSSAMFGLGIILAVGLGWGRKRREMKKQLAA